MYMILLYCVISTFASCTIAVDLPECDLQLPFISNCIANLTSTWSVNETKELANVIINCKSGAQRCINTHKYVNLRIIESRIIGDNYCQCILLDPYSSLDMERSVGEGCGNTDIDAGGGFLTGLKHNNIIIIDSIIRYNGASNGGAAISFYGDQSVLHLKNSELINNHSGYGGGGIIMDTSRAHIENSNITLNSAEYGGGVMVLGESVLNITKSRIQENMGLSGADGIDCRGYYHIANITIDQESFERADNITVTACNLHITQ